MTEPERRVLHAADGHEIHVRAWRPAGDATHHVFILHGLGEHADRYARFAAAANARGCAVYCHDHRGHGPDASDLGYFAVADGWRAVVEDVRQVHDDILERGSGQPLLMLGHSMGAYIAQSFAMHYGTKLSGLILSAATWPARLPLYLAYALARIEKWRLGGHRNSPLLNKIGFGKLNNAFRPVRTESDWLSRDDSEVDKYVADPLCGGPFTAGLWSDLFGGLVEITSDSAISRIRSDLPILITGGECDAVGGDKGMTQLAMHYAQTGHGRLKVMIYPQGRHEMLNDINRDDVTSDWLDWILATSRNGH